MANIKIKNEADRKVKETITLPRWLVEQLKEKSDSLGRSKGSLIQEALVSNFYFEKKS